VPQPTFRHAPHRALLVGLYLASLLLAATPRADELTDLLTGRKKQTEASSKRVIPVESSKKDDAKIQRRLQEIYSQIEELQGVSVSASGGIVTLSGEIASAAVESEALNFANQLEGVVEVENDLVINRELQPRLRAMWSKTVGFARNLIYSLALFLLALAVQVLFWLVGRWVAARLALFQRFTPNHFIARLLGQLAQLAFVVLGLMIALVLLDATALLGTILGAVGIIGLAVGFAVRDTVENYIASVLLSLRNPSAVIDFVDVDGHTGNVIRLTSRATILLSPES